MNVQNTEIVISEWRQKVLNNFLLVMSIMVVPAITFVIINSRKRPELQLIGYILALVGFAVIFLAIFRKINYKIRVVGVLLFGFAATIINLVTFGYNGLGPAYILILPIIAIIMMGKRAGIWTAIACITLLLFSAAGISLNILKPELTRTASVWGSFTTALMLLVIEMTLVLGFYRLQESQITKLQKTMFALREAQSLLEEQNLNLDQKVRERTAQLSEANDNLNNRIQELAALNRISDALSKSLDPKTLSRLVGDKLLEIYDSDSVMITLLDKETNLLNVQYEYDKQSGGYIEYVKPFPLGKGLCSRVIETSREMMLNTFEEELANGAYFPPEIIESGNRQFSQSWLGVPIIHQEEVLGVVAIANYSPQTFTEDNLRLLQTLSANIGITITNARLYQAETTALKRLEKEMEIARTTQMSLLPEALPVVDGYDYGALMIPARAVGGDFYDFFHMNNGCYGIVIGDVSDKGLPAALYMTLTYSLLRVEASMNKSPAEALITINKYLLGMNATSMFVTVLCGTLDVKTNTFNYARAGHPAPLLLDLQGNLIKTPFGKSQAIGIFDPLMVDSGQIVIPEGGTLLLFSDGLSEAINANDQQYDEIQLQMALKGCCQLGSQEICEMLWQDVQKHSGNLPQQDDFTVIAVRRMNRG